MLYQCSKCNEIKESISFAKNKFRKSGRHTECMECQVEYNRIWFAQKNYGLSKDRAKQLIQQIKDETFCDICGELLVLSKNGYAIDHDHKTGKVRGLLCTMCNQGLGRFKDDLYILVKATKYIEKSRGI